MDLLEAVLMTDQKIHHYGSGFHYAHLPRPCDERCAVMFPEMPKGEPCPKDCKALEGWGYLPDVRR